MLAMDGLGDDVPAVVDEGADRLKLPLAVAQGVFAPGDTTGLVVVGVLDAPQ